MLAVSVPAFAEEIIEIEKIPFILIDARIQQSKSSPIANEQIYFSTVEISNDIVKHLQCCFVEDLSKGASRMPFQCQSILDAMRICNELSTRCGYNPHYDIEMIQKQNVRSIHVELVRSGPHFRLPTTGEWLSVYKFAYGETAEKEWRNSGNLQGISTTFAESEEARLLASGYNQDCLRNDTFEDLAPTGSFCAPNLPVYDMIGNVMEYCVDEVDRYFLPPHEAEIRTSKAAFDYSSCKWLYCNVGGCCHTTPVQRIEEVVDKANATGSSPFDRHTGIRICLVIPTAADE